MVFWGYGCGGFFGFWSVSLKCILFMLVVKLFF